MIKKKDLHNAVKAISTAQQEALRVIREGMDIGKEYDITNGFECFDENGHLVGITARVDNDLEVMIDKVRRTDNGFEFHAYMLGEDPCDIWYEDWQFCLPAYELLTYLKCDDE